MTATVESIDLITASILAKKLAAGLHGLVMDVKCGSGAFMASIDQSREPLTRSKQRLLMTTIAKTANDPEATLPKGYLARLLAMTEEEVERELKGADDDDDDNNRWQERENGWQP